MAKSKGEVSVGDYGRMIFELMVGFDTRYVPDHWKSIQAEAEPLVRQLLELNKKMSGGGYNVHGYKLLDGQKALSKSDKILIAQESCKIPASELEEGDLFWYFEDETFMDDEPLVVFEKTDKGVYYEVNNHNIRIALDEDVMLAPDCFKDEDYKKQEEYLSDKYWLKKYDELILDKKDRSVAIQDFNSAVRQIQESSDPDRQDTIPLPYSERGPNGGKK